MQFCGFAALLLGPAPVSSIANTLGSAGHTGTQAPHPMHFSKSICGFIFSPGIYFELQLKS